ncbi:MAG: response regulator transcription factor, partial [Gammaproteobacteria bacterium]|nr:response regulator transcription factor [Gammaproteobacteria bacterium]
MKISIRERRKNEPAAGLSRPCGHRRPSGVHRRIFVPPRQRLVARNQGPGQRSRKHPAGTNIAGVTPPLHLAVLDDEPDITSLLATYLQSRGFRVSQLHAGRDLIALMSSDTPALVLLDLGLPGEDGFAIARQLREHWRCGLVIVTGRGDAVDKVVGLEVGADDYVTKPFDLRELLARINAVLRRLIPPEPAASAPAAARTRLRFDRWELDTAARRLLDPAGEE